MNELMDDSLVSDFVAESREHIDAIEPDLLAMEQEGANVSSEIVNSIFRAIHSIKGGAGFLAFEALKNLSHIMESVLMLIRDGKLTITPEITDVLLSGVDKLRAMVDDLQASDSVPCAEEVEKLTTILEGQGLSTPAKESESANESATADGAAPSTDDAILEILKEFEVSIDTVKAAVTHGQHLYRARAYLHRDLKDKGTTPLDFMSNIESVGQCLDSTLDVADMADLDQCLDHDVSFSFLFLTVLESELISTALELPEDQIETINVSSLRAPAATEEAPMADIEEEATTDEESSTSEPQPAAEAESVATAETNDEHPTEKSSISVETLRVKVDLLSKLMNLAGELVLARNQLLRSVSDESSKLSLQSSVLQNVDRVTTEIQEGIMQTRMQPVGSVFGKFPRVVRDMSRQLNKEIELLVNGSEVELDKSIIELLGDPLTHIIRNCCDHAIEMPDEREAKGKKRLGTIKLDAYHEGGQVNISIVDDGRGIDPEKVAKKAIDNGVITVEQAEKMSQRDKVNLVFAAGFSMAEQISDISGRGVGMDVVRTNIEKLGGIVSLDSVVNEGTTVTLQLPLTLAIIPSLIVGVGNQRYAIPQVNVDEFVWVRAAEVSERIEHVQGQDVLRLRGTLLPLVRLRDILGLEDDHTELEEGERRHRVPDRRMPGSTQEEGLLQPGAEKQESRGQDRRQNWKSDYNIVVVKLGGNRFGAIVDKLFDTEEIVVKPLANFIKNCKCFSGATILGDGRVITILDVMGIANRADLRFADLEAEEKRRMEEEEQRLARAAEARRSVILFNSSEDEFFAVPQDTVMRLERIDVSDIQDVGGREYIQYRGRGLPLIRLDHHLPVGALPQDMSKAFLIIPKMKDAEMGAEALAGVVVSKIVDALDVEVDIRDSDIVGPGVVGSAIVHDQITLFVDLAELMQVTEPAGGDYA